MKIRKKTSLLFIILFVSSFSIVGIITVFVVEKNITQLILNNLKSISAIQLNRIENINSQNLERIKLISSRTQLRISLSDYNENPQKMIQQKMNAILEDARLSVADFDQISIINLKGKIVASTDSTIIGEKTDINDPVFILSQKQNITNIYTLDENNDLKIYMYGPLEYNNKTLGLVRIIVTSEKIKNFITDYTGLGTSGYTSVLFVGQNNDKNLITSPRRNDKLFQYKHVDYDELGQISKITYDKKTGVFKNITNNNQELMFASIEYSENLKLGLSVRISKAEVFKSLRTLLFFLIIVIITIIIILILVVNLSTKLISEPIIKLTEISYKISRGDLEQKIDINSKDEVGQLAKSFNAMVTNLRQSIHDRDLNIIERKKTEEKLKLETFFSQNILSASQAIIVGLDKNHMIRIFNFGAEKITGYIKAEVIGKDWFEIFFPNKILNKMNKVWKDAWGVKSHSYVNSILTKAGEERIISWQSTGIYEGKDINKHLLISIGEDITKRKQAEKALLESEEKFRTLITNTEEIVYMISKDGTFLLSEGKGLSKLDLKPGEVVGKSVFELYKDYPDMLTQMRKAFNGETVTIEVKVGDNYFNTWYTPHKNREGEIIGLLGLSVNITERKQAEEALSHSHDLMRYIIEHNQSDVAVHDREMKYVYVSQSYLEHYKVKERDVIGKHHYDVFPDLPQKWRDVHQRALEGEISCADDDPYVREDGSVDWTRWECRPWYEADGSIGGIIVYTEVITERKKAEEALRQSQEFNKTLLDTSPDLIYIYDIIDRKNIYSNQGIMKILGYTIEEVQTMGENFLPGLMHPDDLTNYLENILPRYQKAVDKEIIYHEYRMKHKNGSWTWLQSKESIFMRQDNGSPKQIFGLTADITERKKAEAELEKYRLHLEVIVKERTHALEGSQEALLNLVDDLNRQSAKLEKTNKQLAETNEELETFTYSVSHDLKAPLRGIDGYGQLLLESFNEELSPDAREFLENIRKSTQQMNLLIEDLLAYSRMERKDFQTENVNFKALIDNLLMYYSKTISTKKIDVKLTFPKAFMPIADKDGLNLVLRNLLDNAIKFTSSNKKVQIEIGGSESDSYFLIFVKDNGIGFDMKYHDRIYKIFQRLHLAEEYEGTGIGLAMVSKAIQRMNGKIWAESAPAQGACFYLEIKK